MKCRKVQKLLFDYRKNLLSPEEREGLREHINRCPECERRLQMAAKLQDLFQMKATELPPAGYEESFWPRLQQKLPAREERAFSRLFLPRGWKPAYSVALGSAFAVVLLVSAALLLLKEEGPAPFLKEDRVRGGGRPQAPAAFVIARASRPGERGEEPDYILDTGYRAELGEESIRPPFLPGPERPGIDDIRREGGQRFVLTAAGVSSPQPRIYW